MSAPNGDGAHGAPSTNSGVIDIVRTAFDDRARSYDDSDMHRSLASAVAAFLPDERIGTVLDVATGTGLVLRALRERYLAERRTPPHLIGVDISAGMLRVAAARLPEAEWHTADAAALPLADASVDVVTCVTALHIVPEVPAMIREWRRVLRPGGLAITASFAQDVAHRPAHISGTRPYPVDHDSYGSPAALESTALAQGFAITRTGRWNDGTDHLLLAEWRPNGAAREAG